MKLFSASLHGEARKWYNDLPAASITTMELFEEIFLAEWTMKIEAIQSLLKELEGIRQAESEIVKVFGFRFERLLSQIPQSHRPEEKYLVYLYTNGLQGHLSFLLSKKNPKTLAEAHNMAIQIEKNLSLTRANAMDILGLIKLVSHENFEDTQEEEEMEASDEMETVHGDEETTHAENTRVLEVPAQEETVSYPPTLVSDNRVHSKRSGRFTKKNNGQHISANQDDPAAILYNQKFNIGMSSS
jgi:hypothetical protein